MRVAVLGATGPSGQEIVKEALQRGHEVIALVRSPEKLTEKNDLLKVHKVDIYNSEELSPHFQGCDAVLSALGQPGLAFFAKITFYEDTIKPIVTAMRSVNVSRFVCMTSWCTQSIPGNPKMIEWFVKPFLIGQHLKSMDVMEQYLFNECSDINYTIVRPPQLVNGPSKGAEIKGVQGQHVPGAMAKILRRDVARFMLDTLLSDDWSRKAVAIST